MEKQEKETFERLLERATDDGETQATYMSIRQRFAMAAMQGVLSGQLYHLDPAVAIHRAIRYADELLLQLNVTPLTCDKKDTELPPLRDWIENTTLSPRAKITIAYNYINLGDDVGERTLQDLINDVRTGDILRKRGIGETTRAEIATALRVTLGMDV